MDLINWFSVLIVVGLFVVGVMFLLIFVIGSCSTGRPQFGGKKKQGG